MRLTEAEKETIERNIMLLKESMDIMHELVYFQGNDLDVIEDTIATVTYDVKKGAEDIAPQNNTWKYAIGTIGAFGLSGLLTALFFLL